MDPDQASTHFSRFRSAHQLSRRGALAASETEFLALWELLPAEQLSPRALDALQKLSATIDSSLKTQALLRGPSMADELIAERRAEAVKES